MTNDERRQEAERLLDQMPEPREVIAAAKAVLAHGRYAPTDHTLDQIRANLASR